MGKKCGTCTLKQLQLDTLARAIRVTQSKIEECRIVKHFPNQPLGKSDLCLACLRQGFAAVAVLGGLLDRPEDLGGRPIRDERSDPSRDGGLWAAARTPADEIYAVKWFRILLWAFLIVGVVGAMALLSWRLG